MPLMRAAALLLLLTTHAGRAYIPPRLLSGDRTTMARTPSFWRWQGYAVARPSTVSVLTALPQQQDAARERSSIRRDGKVKKRHLAGEAVRIYADYAGRLWNETNPEARRAIATTKAAEAIRQVQHIIQGDEYKIQFAEIDDHPRQQLLDACSNLLTAMGNATLVEGAELPMGTTMESVSGAPTGALSATENATSTTLPGANAVALENGEETTATLKKKKKPRRSILFGATMGLVVAGWVFSGSYIFTGLFTLMTLLGQLEYYRMVINTGVYPARRISVVGACSMFLTALFTPNYHQLCLPLFGLWAMIWFLTMKRTATTIPQIATTFTGMFYLGYVPSFWVRIRLLGAGREPTRLAPLAGPFLRAIQNKAEASLPSFMPKAVHLPITTGAIFIFWSWLCLAFADVGAYFVGKNFGKTKLSRISPAAGATSPNKTVEGVLGGCAVSAMLGMLGKYFMRRVNVLYRRTRRGV
jgi:CDP-diglyceride synthetase